MKFLVFAIMVATSLNLMAFEYESRLVCRAGRCEKIEEFGGLKEVKLKISDISPGQCLIDIKTQMISRVESIDQKSTKVVSLSEVEDHILLREVVFFDSRSFNRSRKIVPCSEVAGVLGDEAQFQKCLDGNGGRVQKLFCEFERVHNF